MNANELADELDYCYGKEYPCPVSKEAATMLRQQQAEIEALKLRELTDEEIIKVYEDMLGVASAKGSAIDFARVIFKKASEK